MEHRIAAALKIATRHYRLAALYARDGLVDDVARCLETARAYDARARMWARG